MSRQSPDMEGMTFGEWTVLSRAYSGGSAGWFWLCQCSCGELAAINGTRLRLGRTTRCVDCKRRSEFVDLTGQRFGQWTVLKQAKTGPHRQTFWLCRCSCGTEAERNGQILKGGASTRCRPCARKNWRKKPRNQEERKRRGDR